MEAEFHKDLSYTDDTIEENNTFHLSPTESGNTFSTVKIISKKIFGLSSQELSSLQLRLGFNSRPCYSKDIESDLVRKFEAGVIVYIVYLEVYLHIMVFSSKYKPVAPTHLSNNTRYFLPFSPFHYQTHIFLEVCSAYSTLFIQ